MIPLRGYHNIDGIHRGIALYGCFSFFDSYSTVTRHQKGQLVFLGGARVSLLEVRLPTELAEGEYSVVIQVNHQLRPHALRTPLTFGSLHLGALRGETFRREDTYGDDGR